MSGMQRSRFWPGKRVLVTGGAGFLGSFVVERLKARGAAEVVVPRAEDHELADAGTVRRVYDEILRTTGTAPSGGSDVLVIHLAGLSGGIGANRARPAEFFYVNLMMGMQLIHEGWRRGVGKFVAVGTVCSYPMLTPLPFRESELWNGYPAESTAPYGLAKKMLLVQAQAYRQQYGFNTIYLIPVNLYGPRDDFDPETSHVIPGLIRKFMGATERSEPAVTLWGDGSPTREFLYVEDAAEAILLAAERYDGPEPVNLGSGIEVKIKDLAERIARLTGYAGDVRWDSGEAQRAAALRRGRPPRRAVLRVQGRDGLRRRASENHRLVRTERMRASP